MTPELLPAQLPEISPTKEITIQTSAQAKNLVRELERSTPEEKRAGMDALRTKLSAFDATDRIQVITLQSLAKLSGINLVIDGLFGIRSKIAAEFLGLSLPSDARLVPYRTPVNEARIRQHMQARYQPQKTSDAPASSLSDEVAQPPEQAANESARSPEVLQEERQSYESYANDRLKPLAKAVMNHDEKVLYITSAESQIKSALIPVGAFETLSPEMAQHKLEALVARIEQEWAHFRLPEWTTGRLEWSETSVAERYEVIERECTTGDASDQRKLDRLRDAISLVHATELPDRLKVRVIEGFIHAGSDNISRLVEIIRGLHLASSVKNTLPTAVWGVVDVGVVDAIMEHYATFKIDDADFGRQFQALTGANILAGQTEVDPRHAKVMSELLALNPDLFRLVFTTSDEFAKLTSEQTNKFLDLAQSHKPFLASYPKRIAAIDPVKYPWIGNAAWVKNLVDRISENIITAIRSDKIDRVLPEFSKLFEDPNLFDRLTAAFDAIQDPSARQVAINQFLGGKITSLDRLKAYSDIPAAKEAIGNTKLTSLQHLSEGAAKVFSTAFNDLSKKMGKEVDMSMIETYQSIDRQVTRLIAERPESKAILDTQLAKPMFYKLLNTGVYPVSGVAFWLEQLAKMPTEWYANEFSAEFSDRLFRSKDFTTEKDVQSFHQAVAELKGGKYPLLPKDKVYSLLLNRAKANISEADFGRVLGALAEVQKAVDSNALSKLEGEKMSANLATSFQQLHGDGKFRSMLSPDNASYIAGDYSDKPPYFLDDAYKGLNSLVRTALMNGTIGKEEVTYMSEVLFKPNTVEWKRFAALPKKSQDTMVESFLSGKMGFKARTIDGGVSNVTVAEKAGFILAHADEIIGGPNSLFKRPENASAKLYGSHDVMIRESFFSGYLSNEGKFRDIIKAYNSGDMNGFSSLGTNGLYDAVRVSMVNMKVDAEMLGWK